MEFDSSDPFHRLILAFTPYPGLPPKVDETLWMDVKRVDLREIASGTLIMFRGRHWCSQYLSEVVKDENGRQIRLWANRDCEGLIGPIDSVVSIPPNAMLKLETWERGVMELRKLYSLPYFVYAAGGRQATQDPCQPRIEPYTLISIQHPDGRDI